MTYTNGDLDAAVPSNAESVGNGAQRVRNLTLAMLERLASFFQDPDADPLVPKNNSIPVAAIADIGLFALPGMIMPYAGPTPPTGWLTCDGLAVSRTTYSGLFAVLGVRYGPGDGTTTFNLPNLQGRTVIGVGEIPGGAGRVLAASGGTEGHVLTVNEMPSHNHGGSTGGVNGPMNIFAQELESGSPGNGLQSAFNVSATSVFNTHTHSIPNQGNGAAHNNMQPFLVLNYIIKA